MKKTAAILTETVVEERTQTEYTIVHSGNVISARREPHFQRFFDKREATLGYLRKKSITDITSITLLDDQEVNTEYFIRKSDGIFDVRYPDPTRNISTSLRST